MFTSHYDTGSGDYKVTGNRSTLYLWFFIPCLGALDPCLPFSHAPSLHAAYFLAFCLFKALSHRPLCTVFCAVICARHISSPLANLPLLKQFLEIEQKSSVVHKKNDSISWPSQSLCPSQKRINKRQTRKTLDTIREGSFPGCE